VKVFRRRLLTVAAVFFAFALGIALGAGPLGGDGEVLPGLPNRGQSNAAVTSFESQFVDRTSGDLVRGRLKGHSVALLVVEGADDEQVERVRAALKDAGATITGKRTLTAKLTDTANRQFADSVARQTAGDAVSEGTDSYRRIGAALARAVVNKAKGSPDATAQTIWSAFAEGGFVSGKAPGSYADSVALVVGDERSDTAPTVIAGLMTSLDAAAQGAVAAGPSESSLVGGAIEGVRDRAAGASTVDVTDSVAGGLLVALALQSDAAGEPGAWGTPRSANGALPAK
jgi:hypothetical protein